MKRLKKLGQIFVLTVLVSLQSGCLPAKQLAYDVVVNVFANVLANNLPEYLRKLFENLGILGLLPPQKQSEATDELVAKIVVALEGKIKPPQETDTRTIMLSCKFFEDDNECIERHYPTIQKVQDELKESLNSKNEQIKKDNEAVIGEAESRIREIEKKYHECHDMINENPNIHLDDLNLIYDLKVECLLDGGFEEEMLTLSNHSQELYDAIKKINVYGGVWSLYFAKETRLDENEMMEVMPPPSL